MTKAQMYHESWGFKNLETGQIHDVSKGCTVTKLENLEDVECQD